MKLDKIDNDIIINHIYEWNKKTDDVQNKMAMDVYIESIDFLEDDDVTFNCIRIKPITDSSCGISEDNVGKSLENIGDNMSIKLSEFKSPYKEIIRASIREIKLSKIIK